MRQLDYLKERLEEIVKLDEQRKQIGSEENRDAHRGLDGSAYPYMFGQLDALTWSILNSAKYALKSVEELAQRLADFESYELREKNGGRSFSVSIPRHTYIRCQHCGTAIECEVNLDDDAGGPEDLTVAYAEIETDSCDDCNKRLCVKCQRFRHPDDDDLIQCAECHEKAAVRA